MTIQNSLSIEQRAFVLERLQKDGNGGLTTETLYALLYRGCKGKGSFVQEKDVLGFLSASEKQRIVRREVVGNKVIWTADVCILKHIYDLRAAVV